MKSDTETEPLHFAQRFLQLHGAAVESSGSAIEALIPEELRALLDVPEHIRISGDNEYAAENNEYAASPENMDIAERNTQVAIGACLDIGKIIIANQGLPEPSDNKAIFSVLAEAGIITKESLSFLMPIAETRNILVHGYDRIDNALIYGIIKKHLDNFESFLNQISVSS